MDAPACGIVLQVVKIQNISAPKANEESKTAPRLLQLDLTDGQNYCSGLELEHIAVLSMNTAPGTKVLLKGNIKMNQGMLVLGPQNVSISGGHVATLFDKWDINRTLSKYAKGIRINTGPGGPPPWIPFGQKSQQQQTLSTDKSFKSLNAEKEKEESKENVEFNATRNEAIAEASKLKQKKVFGGGNRQLIDFNVKKIMEKGYTEEQAKTALKYARNNLERAMGSLKRRDEKSGSPLDSNGRAGGGRGFKEDRRKGKMEITEGAKPSGTVSLFDFLEDKIPQAPQSTYQKPTNKSYSNAAPVPSAVNNYKRTDDKKPPYTSNKIDSGANRISGKSITSPPSLSSSTIHTSGNSVTSQNHHLQSSHLDNRNKFENNISTSFASRQKRDDEPPIPANASNKNYAGNKPNNYSANQRHTNNNYPNATAEAKFNNDSRNQNDSRNFNKPNYGQQQSVGGYNNSTNYSQQHAPKYVKGSHTAEAPVSIFVTISIQCIICNKIIF